MTHNEENAGTAPTSADTAKIRLTILSENTVHRHGLLAEHGWAVWIESPGTKILFDTGQGFVLRHNAKRLEIDLLSADHLVLSHGHFDHTGGLASLLADGCTATIHAHPDVWRPKYADHKGHPRRSIGVTREWTKSPPKYTAVTEPASLDGTFRLTGQIPRNRDFETVEESFLAGEDVIVHDEMLDDLAMFFDTCNGLVVLTGCSHAGIINTLETVRKLVPGRPIDTVIGGMHPRAADEDRLSRTLSALWQYDVRRVIPAHCTGRRASLALSDAWGDRCVPCSVGDCFEFVPAE